MGEVLCRPRRLHHGSYLNVDAFALLGASVATHCIGALVPLMRWLQKLLKISIPGLGWELAEV